MGRRKENGSEKEHQSNLVSTNKLFVPPRPLLEADVRSQLIPGWTDPWPPY